MSMGIHAMLLDLILHFLLHMSGSGAKRFDAIDHIDHEVEAVDLVDDGQFERCVDISIFFIAADMETTLLIPSIDQPVNQPRIAVEIENDGLIRWEQAVEVALT